MKDCIIKKSLILVIIGMFLVINIIPSLAGISVKKQVSIKDNLSIVDYPLRATTLYVGGSGPGNYSSIQVAINNAVDGDTIFIFDDSSPYYENLVVDKTINIIGENRDTTVINGNNAGDVILIINASVKINYVTVTNSGGGPLDAGIQIDNKKYCRIKECKAVSNSIGIFLDNSDSSYIEQNIFSSNNLYGTYLLNSDYVIVSDNICNNNNIGIFLSSSDEGLIRYNDCLNNIIAGINTSNGCDDFTLLSNVCKYSDYGISIDSCFEVIIENNECSDGDNGIFLYNSYTVEAGNNTCNNVTHPRVLRKSLVEKSAKK